MLYARWVPLYAIPASSTNGAPIYIAARRSCAELNKGVELFMIPWTRQLSRTKRHRRSTQKMISRFGESALLVVDADYLARVSRARAAEVHLHLRHGVGAQISYLLEFDLIPHIPSLEFVKLEVQMVLEEHPRLCSLS